MKPVVQHPDRKKAERTFRLGTTSFIFPDHILPNIVKLGPYVEEIELLVFESLGPGVLPSQEDVEQFDRARPDNRHLTFNVHLPTDIFLADRDADNRKSAAKMYATVISLFEPLSPSTHTLHLEKPEKSTEAEFVRHAGDGLAHLLDTGVDPRGLSIETLDDSFFLVAPIVADLGLPLCIDLGHAMKYGYDPASLFETHLVPVVHLHGVDPAGKDHVALDLLDHQRLAQVLDLLSSYKGVVSLEVFNRDHFVRSLEVLDRFFEDIPRVPF